MVKKINKAILFGAFLLGSSFIEIKAENNKMIDENDNKQIAKTELEIKKEIKKMTEETYKNTEIGQHLDLDTFTQSDSGIYSKTLKKGGDKKAYPGETVTVHYTGWLLDPNNNVGKKFDSSVDRGQHFKFPLGAGYVIQGWDISVADMKIGEKRLVVLPSELGYGAHGAGALIPPNAKLIFEIELFAAA